MTISKIIYGLLSLILILGGGIGLLNPGMNIPISEGLSEINAGYFLKLQASLIHHTQELGAAVLALGGLCLWAVFNTSKMTQLNYILLLFFLLLGGIHWYEYFIGNRTLMSPLINSIPIGLMAIVMIFSKRNESV